MLFDSHAAQMAWEASGIRLPSRRVTIHPCNRDEWRQAAMTEHLSWPGSSKGEGLGRLWPGSDLACAKTIFSCYVWVR